MNRLVALLLFLPLLALTILPTAGHNCHLRELDYCAATILIFTQNPSGIATTESQLAKQCGYLHEAEQCFQNFTQKCTTPLQRELISFLTEGSHRLLSEYCTPRSQVQRDFLRYSGCLNRITRSGSGTPKPCVRNLKLALDIVPRLDWNKRIPAGCCAYRQFLDCTELVIEQKCGKEAIEFFGSLLRMALSRLPEIVCTGYGVERPECAKLLDKPAKANKESRSKSVLSRLFTAYTGF